MNLSPRAIEAAVKAIDNLDHRAAISMADLTRQIAEAAIAAYLDVLAVDGLCLVPKEPSDEMLDAAYIAGSMENDESMIEIYRAMIAAASTGDSPREDNKK